MAIKIEWGMTAKIQGGPTLTASETVEVEAYDKVEVVVATNETAKKVGLQPGETAGQVKFLMITAKPYRDSSGNSLTYTVNDGTTGITLDAPQVLVGSGGVALLDSAPKSLSFTSTLSQDVSIQILVGRDATP